MYLSGLDELDRKILDLLTQNARYTYSELGERLGISRVAVKNRMDALEARGVRVLKGSMAFPGKGFMSGKRPGPEDLEAARNYARECLNSVSR